MVWVISRGGLVGTGWLRQTWFGQKVEVTKLTHEWTEVVRSGDADVVSPGSVRTVKFGA
jgi:hypothetical protein